MPKKGEKKRGKKGGGKRRKGAKKAKKISREKGEWDGDPACAQCIDEVHPLESNLHFALLFGIRLSSWFFF